MAAELKAKGQVEASMMAAYKNADEERQRKKETEETLAKVTKPAAIHTEVGLISEVFAYRVFKKVPQWCVSGPQMAPCHGRCLKSWTVITFAQRLANFRSP